MALQDEQDRARPDRSLHHDSPHGQKAAFATRRKIMTGQEIARNLHQQEPGRGKRHAAAAGTPTTTRDPARHHESAGDYHGIVARLSAMHRVIICKDQIQWILQRRDGERHGQARWVGIGYFLTREALLRASRALCAELDPAALAALAALPDHFGRAGT